MILEEIFNNPNEPVEPIIWERYAFASRKIARMKKRYFDDLKDGEHLHCQPVVFTREAIINFGKKFDPCTWVVVEAQGNVAILSGVGMHEAKMFNPVRPGDILSVNARWTELKRSRSKPDRGFASIKCKVTN